MPIHNRFIRDRDGNLSPEALIGLGAFLNIEIHVPPAIATALTDAGSPVPAPVTGVALIDTGATITCIHEPILRDQLGLNPISVMKAGTASGPTQQNVYPARIVGTVAQSFTLDLDGVAGVNLSGQIVNTLPDPQEVVALLGRNFLSHCVLIWNGPGGFWTISI